MNISNDRATYVTQLQQQLGAATQELSYASTSKGVDQTRAKIESIQAKITECLTAWNQEVTQLKAKNVSSFKLLTTLAVNEGWVKIAREVQKDANQLLLTGVQQAKNEALVLKVAQSEARGALSSLTSNNPKEREIIKSYRNLSASCDPPLSSSLKRAILKCVIAAVTHEITGTHVMNEAVGEKTKQFLVVRDKNIVHVLPHLASGADADVYRIGQNVFKVAKQNPEAQLALTNETRIFEHMRRPGCNEMHGANNVEQYRCFHDISSGTSGLMVHYYNKGDFRAQTILLKFSQDVLHISERKLRTLNQADKEALIDQQLAKVNPQELAEFCQKADTTADVLIAKLKHEYIPFDSKGRESLCRQLIDGYKFMAANGVIHGDLKPDNVRWEMVDGAPRFVHGDLGRASLTNDQQRSLGLLSNFIFAKEANPTPQGSGIRDVDSIRSFADLFKGYSKGSANGKERVLTAEQAIQAFAQGGLLVQQGEKFLLNHEPLAEFRKILPDLMKGTATIGDSKLQRAWEDAGLITPGAQGYRLAFSVTADESSAIERMVAIALQPVKGLVGTKEYSTNDRLAWAMFFAKTGNRAMYEQAVESTQQFALGVTLYEMVTGKTLKRDPSGCIEPLSAKDLRTVERRLRSRGISEETRSQIVNSLKPVGIPPETILDKIFQQDNDQDATIFKQEMQALSRNDTYPNFSAKYLELAQKYGFTMDQLRFQSYT